jgi:hypothetical protein
MTDHTIAIAPIPLARATGRMLVAPLVLLLAGAAAVAGGLFIGGLVGIGLVAAGLVVAVLSLYLAGMLLTIRLDVEVATLHLRWLGGERRYILVRGPVTRVALQGQDAARLRPRFGAMGWAVGRAKLRGQEMIDIVRLTPTASMILVPTDRGRLGIAPASEEHLLSALAAAARIQQRLDEVAERARAFMDLPAPAEPVAPAPEGRRMLTGIERQLLEERLAAERASALQRAEAERTAAMAAAAAEAVAVPGAEEAAAASGTAARERRRGRWRRPAWLSRRRAVPPPEAATTMTAAVAAGSVAEAPPVPAHPPEPIVEPMPPEPIFEPEPTSAPVAAVVEPTVAAAPALAVAPVTAAKPVRVRVRDGQWLAFGLALTPVIGAGAIWLIASMRGELTLSVEALRPIALALLAIGPVGALAALAARAWYPRLQGLVTITALTGLVLVGRVLLG